MTAIPGTVGVTGIVAPKDSADTYAVGDTQYIKGAPLQLANLATLEAWAYPSRLTVGQIGYATDTGKYYKLTVIGPPNTWVEFAAGGDLWSETSGKLNTVSADDVALNTDKAYEFKQPTNSTFYSTFSATVDADYSLGTATGTASGGAAIVAGKLDLAHTDNRYVSYVATSNADSQQVGAFKFKIIPNYSGSPVAIRPIFSVASALSANLNEISLWHAADGTIRLNISDSAGSPIISNVSFGVWGQTALTEYEFELNFDITTGATRLFIDGNQAGSTDTSTGTRNSSIAVLLIGQLVPNPTFLSNIYIKDFIVFNAVQHTGNYVAGYTLHNVKISKTKSVTNDLQAFGDLILSNSPVAGGVLQTDTNGVVSSSVIIDPFPSEVIHVRQFGTDIAEIYYPAGTTGTGFINVAADFPAGWGGVTQGDCWMVPNGVTVTDNDATKTNTGQTFVGPVQIAADKTNTRWIERDGLTEDTCVSSIAAACYLATIYSGTFSIVASDAATYTFGDGQGFFKPTFAPSATFLFLASSVCFAPKLNVNVMTFTGGASQGMGCDSCEINFKSASFTGTPSSSSIFRGTSTGNVIINAGSINGGTSTQAVISIQSTGKMHVTVGKITGKIYVASGTSTITIITADRTDITTIPSNGKILLGSNLDDIEAIAQITGQTYKGGNNFYADSTSIIAVGAENSNALLSLTETPDGSAQTYVSIAVTSAAPILGAAFLYNAELNKIAIERGVWVDKMWAHVVTNNTATTQVIKLMCTISGNGIDDVVTTTGSGTSRTATITSSLIIFSPGDASANPLVASYLQTPKGLYQITAYIAANSVTIKTPVGYVNEAGVLFKKWHNVITITSADIKNTYLKEITTLSTVQSAFSLDQNNTLGVIVFGQTTSALGITIRYYINGDTTYSHIEVPKLIAQKSYITWADTGVGSGTRAHYLLTNGSTYAFNFYIPQDADQIDTIQLLFNPASSSTGMNVDLTTNYTVAVNGSITEYSASDTTSTYIFTAGYVNRIPFKTLILSAKHGVNGSLVTTNSSGINMEIYGIEVLYR